MKKNHKEHDLNKTIEDDCCDETRHLLLGKIERLEKVVLELQGELEYSRYMSREVDWEDDRTLKSLIRRNSHEVKCD